MRSREEIKKDIQGIGSGYAYHNQALIIELLLDIRDHIHNMR